MVSNVMYHDNPPLLKHVYVLSNLFSNRQTNQPYVKVDDKETTARGTRTQIAVLEKLNEHRLCDIMI